MILTPQEKAKELIDKMLMYSEFIYDAQKNALITVDELIYETQFEVPNIRQRYWQEVKQEIEKL